MKRVTLLALLLCVPAFATTDPTELKDVLERAKRFDQAVAHRKEPDVQEFLHADYTYVEPVQQVPPLLPAPGTTTPATTPGARLKREAGQIVGEPVVRIVGDTAIVTGHYRVVERPVQRADPGSKPRGPQSTAAPAPRLESYGQFTETWVRADRRWLLLAEHRSLHDTMTWASSPPKVSPPPSAPRTETTASASPVDAPPLTATAPAGDPQPAVDPKQRKAERAALAAHRGFLPPTLTDLFRSYEPTHLGYTVDQGNDSFMDFTFSAMFPLWANDDYPPPVRRLKAPGFLRRPNYTGPNLYGAATIRAGQYIGTRPSSPVVGKRFNPLFALRFWELDGRELASEDNFFEFVYAHESDGQFIASKGRLIDQETVYRNQRLDATKPAEASLATDTAARAARDNISRGWDYIGFQFSRDWDRKAPSFLPWLHGRDVTIAFNAKLNYYLPWGFMQKHAEEFNPSWETAIGGTGPDPEGKARKYVDGLSFGYTLTVNPEGPSGSGHGTVRRYSLTWTTGYRDPARFNTLKAEFSFAFFHRLPITLWYRYGYNSDFIDYYHKDHSYGLSLTYWNF
ncbi:MAG: hypothetical protein NTV51_27265 [Verrucomicrobia bacterium]|nr:hypothetical protein [Verrucomicrobiota bacterium]